MLGVVVRESLSLFLVVLILLINETAKLVHLFVSSSMVLERGLKLSICCCNKYYWR